MTDLADTSEPLTESNTAILAAWPRVRWSGARPFETICKMLRIISLALAGSMLPSAPTRAAPVSRILVLAPRQTVESLHQTGEERFEAGDYAGAREAWMGAYEQVESADDTWPYRTTLLSLIVTATLSEFSEGGDREPVRGVASMLDAALEADLDLELQEILTAERERLTPYLDPPPEPEVEPEPLPIVEDIEEPRKRTVPNGAWIGVGATVLAGGVGAIIAGSRFRPRAVDDVRQAGDSTSDPEAQGFIDEETRKGNGWMIAGSVLATAGAAALIVGIVRLVRDKE